MEGLIDRANRFVGRKRSEDDIRIESDLFKRVCDENFVAKFFFKFKSFLSRSVMYEEWMMIWVFTVISDILRHRIAHRPETDPSYTVLRERWRLRTGEGYTLLHNTEQMSSMISHNNSLHKQSNYFMAKTKSCKKREKRRHNPMRVPDTHLQRGLAAALQSSAKSDAVLPIIKKVFSLRFLLPS